MFVQNHNEISPHACQKGDHQKDKYQMLVRMQGKRTLVHFWWECKLVQPPWKTVCRFFKQLKLELPCDSASPLLGIYSKKTKTLMPKDICIPMFPRALFTIARTWKQPRCPTKEEWINKMGYIGTQNITQP